MQPVARPLPRVSLASVMSFAAGLLALLVFGESVLAILAAVAGMMALRASWPAEKRPVVRALAFQGVAFAASILTLIISPSCGEGAMLLMVGMIFTATLLSRTSS